MYVSASSGRQIRTIYLSGGKIFQAIFVDEMKYGLHIQYKNFSALLPSR